MNQLRSPFNYSFTVTENDGFREVPKSFSGASHYVSNSSNHSVYIERGSRGVVLLGERFSLSNGDLKCDKAYINAPKNLDIIEHDNHSKTTVLNSTLTVPAYNEFELSLKEEIEITDHQHGTLYLPSSIIDAIRLTITINRVYDRQSLDGFPFSDELEKLIRPERYRVYINPEDDQILSMIKEGYNGSAESVLFKSDNGSRPQFNPTAEEQFTVYPTVSYGDVGIEFYGFAPATYRLEVYSILGTKMWTKSYQVDGNASFSADLSFLPKGNYQYSLIGPNGYRILSKRLGIIKY